MTSTPSPAEEGGMPTRTDVVDVCQPGANMWGCVNCPKCGSECRNATDEYFGDPADRDARAAAIQVNADYHFSQGCS